MRVEAHPALRARRSGWRRPPRRPAGLSNASSIGGAGADRRAPQDLMDDGHIVEWELASVLEFLALLMALTGDDHDVAGPGLRDRLRDGFAPVGVVRSVRPGSVQD